MSNILRGISGKASGNFKKGSGNGGGRLGAQPIGDDSKKRILLRGMKELGQPEDQEQEREEQEQQNFEQSGMQGQEQGGEQNGQDQGQAQGQDQGGGGDDGDGGGESKGMFGQWNQKRKDEKKIKKIKKDIKKDKLKDEALGQYLRRGVFEPNLKWAIGREPMMSPVNIADKLFRHANEDKKKTAAKIDKAKTGEEAEQLKKEFDKQEKDVKLKGGVLLAALMAVNIKRAIEGPHGCFKDLKAVFFRINIVALFVIGGLVTMILSLCGVF